MRSALRHDWRQGNRRLSSVYVAAFDMVNSALARGDPDAVQKSILRAVLDLAALRKYVPAKQASRIAVQAEV